MQPKSTSEVLRLQAWQCFGKHVSSHVLSWTVLEAKRAIPNNIANKMVTDIDVFCASMKLVIFHEGNGGLVVAIEGCHTVKRAEDFAKERAQLQSLLCNMSSSNIFCFGRGQGNDLLGLD